MKERINLILIIFALWAFLYIFQKYFTSTLAIVFLMIVMFLYGVYMQIAYKHKKRQQRKHPVDLDYSYKPFVSILVPAHNEDTVIAKTVENLVNLDYPDYEIIVIDDRSTDNTAQRIK